MVPDVVSAVLSYEAERLMVGGRLESYEHPDREQRPLLRLTQSTSGVLSRHRLLLLLLPCLPLADRAHPLEAPAGQDRRAWVRARVEELLTDSGLPDPQDEHIDDRWDWAAPLLLDPGLPGVLRAWRDEELPGSSDGQPLLPPNPDVFGAYVDELLAIDPRSLGRRPRSSRSCSPTSRSARRDSRGTQPARWVERRGRHTPPAGGVDRRGVPGASSIGRR